MAAFPRSIDPNLGELGALGGSILLGEVVTAESVELAEIEIVEPGL